MRGDVPPVGRARRSPRAAYPPGLKRLRQDLAELYGFHFKDPRRERLFISSLSFLVTWIVVRVIVHLIRAGVGPFHNVSAGGTHIHHLVWGILLLLVAGYLAQLEADDSDRLRFLLAVLFGVEAALTLDEFALWFFLADVYWARQGRDSVDAVIAFFGLLSLGIWGGPFLRELTRRFVRRPALAN